MAVVITPGATSRTFSDSRPVRMRFTPTVDTFTTRRVWIRAYRDVLAETELPGDLTVKLLRGATLLASITAAPGLFEVTPLDESWELGILPKAAPIPLVSLDLGVNIEVQSGQEHSLVLGATSGFYTTHAQAWLADFQSRNTFDEGVAEFSLDSGATWNGWTSAAGFPSTRMVLPFLFELTIAPEPPVGTLALMAKSIVEAAGVNTAFHTDTYETNYTVLKSRLTELGVTWLRATPTADVTRRGRFLDLATAGFRFLFSAGNGGHGYETADNILAWVKQLNTDGGGEGRVAIAVEPENEADNRAGETATDWVPRLQTQMIEMGTDYPADVATDSLTIVGPAFGKIGSYTALRTVFSTAAAYFAKASLHAYCQGDHPEGGNGGGSGVSLLTLMERAKLSGNDPVWLTMACYRPRSELLDFELDIPVDTPDPDPDPGPDPDPPPADDAIPAATRTINVTNNTQLTAALAGNFSGLTTTPNGASGPLVAGDHILCNGNFTTGTFTADTAGTAAKPIVIKASAVGNATFTGKIEIAATRVILSKLDFTGGGTKVSVKKTYGRVSRCRFTGGTADGKISIDSTTCANLRVDRNTFQNFTGAAIRGNIDSVDEIKGTRIDRNLFKGHTCTSANELVILFLTDMFNDANLIVEYNRFDDTLIGAGPGLIISQKELITVKTSGVTLRGNTITGDSTSTKGIFFSLREACRCVVEDNVYEIGSHCRAGGDDHVFRNNKSTGTVLELSSGDAYATSPDAGGACNTFAKKGKTRLVLENGNCVSAHTGIRNATVEDNIGDINIGDPAYTGTAFKVRDVTLRRNSKAVDYVANTYVASTITESNVGGQNNTAVKLALSDVGHGS